jgi:hypothetical protein
MFVSMHTPAVPAVSEWLDEYAMLMLSGAMTAMSFVAVCVPTVSVIVTVAGASGAVHANAVPEAPAAGVPPVAVQVPAAEPVKSMTSPTATVVRVAEPPPAAALRVADVIVGGGSGVLAFPLAPALSSALLFPGWFSAGAGCA